MRVADLKTTRDSYCPRILELNELDRAYLRGWVDALIREEGHGWPFADDFLMYQALVSDCFELVQRGAVDAVPGLVAEAVERVSG